MQNYSTGCKKATNHSQDDINLLNTCTITPTSGNYPTTAQHLYRMNLEVDAYNNHIFAISHNMKYTAKAVDSVVGSVSSEMTNRVLALIPNDPRKTLQLP